MKRLAVILLSGALTGCLEAPPLEDRWTRLDLRGVEWVDATTLHVTGDITYRAIRTGFVAAEVRRMDADSGAFHLHPDGPRRALAAEVHDLLSRSTQVSGASRPVTGWDHLIQRVEFDLTAAPDSTGQSFVVLYLGAGERMAVSAERDSIVVRPWDSDSTEVLPDAAALEVRP